MSKKNLTYIVAIAWQSGLAGGTKICLRTSIYFAIDDKINNEAEALGRAILEQRKGLDDPDNFIMLVHNTATTWQENDKADLSCLRYC